MGGRKTLAVTAGVLIAVSFAAVYFENSDERALSGVPYHGFYDNFYLADSSAVNAVLMLLEYWERRSFSANEVQDSLWRIGPQALTIQKINIFFQRRGYQTEILRAPFLPDIIGKISKFLNTPNGIPLIVYQYHAPKISPELRSYRLIIGASGKEKNMIVHDYYYGNHYKISYEDFLSNLRMEDAAILAVWPSGESAPEDIRTRRTPKSGVPYAEEIGNFMSRWSALMQQSSEDPEITAEKIVAMYQSPVFLYLPPAYRISLWDYAADLLMISGDYRGAINLLETKALPLNQNLDDPFGAWEGHIRALRHWIPNLMTTNELSRPYVLLGLAYAKTGDQISARTHFNRALRIHPNHLDVLAALAAIQDNDDAALRRVIWRIPNELQKRQETFGTHTL